MSASAISTPLASPQEGEVPRSPVPPSHPPQGEGMEFDLSYYWFLLYSRRWQILAFATVATVLVALLSLALPKKYRSTAMLRVDPQGRSTVGDTSALSGNNVDPTLLVSTEAQVVTSPAVLTQLIESLKLAQVPEFAPPDYHGGALTELQKDQVLQRVAGAVSVGQPIGTLLLSIAFTCHDPHLAYQAANTLSQVYLEHEYATRAQALSDASKNMAQQLDSLRAQMEQSQSALVVYESTHDVISPDNTNNIYQARLSQINTALSTAEAKRIELEAEYTVTRAGNPDAMAATPPGKALQPLEDRLHEDQAKLAAVATVYGPRHPLYQQQFKVVESDRQMLQTSAEHIGTRVAEQYQAALLQEQLVQAALKREKAAMDAFNMRAIRYHSLKAAADSSTQLYNDLQLRIQDATVAAGLHSEELRIISPAQPSPIPVFPRPFFYGLLAFVASLGLAGAGVVVWGLLDKSVSSPEQVEQRFHCRVLAALPLVKGSDLQLISPGRFASEGQAGAVDDTLDPAQRHNPFDEAILGLQSTLRFAADGEPIRVLAITSSMPGEGKSTISCYLATVLAAMGLRTVLVDADIRKPSDHRKFQTSNKIGLASVLRGQETLAQALQTLTPKLSLLTAGPAQLHMAELLHQRLAEILDQLRSQFDFVVVDSPPALGFADATVIASLADGYLLVASAGKTERSQVAAAFRQLDGVRSRRLGMVLNRVSAKVGGYYEYFSNYSEYYGAGNSDEEDDD